MRRNPLRHLSLAMFLSTISVPLTAQGASQPLQPPAAAPSAEAPRVMQAVRASGAIRVDGRADEAAWAAAQVATDFVQRGPRPGEASTERTEVRFLYDDQAVYVAARMWDRHPDSIAAPLARRDQGVSNSDWFDVALDSYHDRRTAFRFSVNPAGLRRDIYHFNDDNDDDTWDAVWDVAVSRDSAGWSAEFRIPLSQLRFNVPRDGAAQTWGINFGRVIARRDESSFWAPLLPNTSGIISRFGTVQGLAGLRAPRRLEIMPYSSARVDRQPDRPGDPYYSATEGGAAVGVDVKMGLTSGLTLTGTVNPDFGQVELDPAVVNLTAFETQFEERRPFFVEGNDVFQFGQSRAFNSYGGQGFFYSRRIGRAPQAGLGTSDDRPYVDQPEQSSILGAAKVTGRTAGGWSLGLLNAVTGREQARYVDAEGDEHTAPVEPMTNYLVGRVRRDLNGGGTVVGGMVTATNRNLDARLEPLLRRDAYVGGVDFEHSWAKRLWTLSGYVAGSTVGGSAEAIERTQRSSGRYFQRPDADHVELDADRTRLSGHSASLAIQRAGDWDMSVKVQNVSPGFEMNDLGFAQRGDVRSFATFLGTRRTKPTPVLRQYSIAGFTTHAWNTAGDPIFADFGMGLWGQLHSLWSGGLNLSLSPATRDDRLTRGGPLGARPTSWGVNAHFNSDSRKPFSLNMGAYVGGDQAGGESRSVGLNLNYRPSPSMRLSMGPSWDQGRDPDQYLFDFEDESAEATFGQRYVFGALDQTVFAVNTRLDWTFTPTLSLQLYAQPFVAAGDFRDFREFTTPGKAEYDVYGRDRGSVCGYDGAYALSPVASVACPATVEQAEQTGLMVVGNPDFNVRSLRGNAVVRWEYRPGSALFFVWQQERQGFEGIGGFDARRDVGSLFRAPARNVFMIKATYWIG
ncbi:DUF5916 domain-containing protein [Longimicrobium sp.]|uniref:DUF5916 domain-containing protein n=1 Tax=Longimicrobium sp. TaxID=2029185 RepID=UPI002F94AFC8